MASKDNTFLRTARKAMIARAFTSVGVVSSKPISICQSFLGEFLAKFKGEPKCDC